jgi:hypothetical protein
MRIHIKNYVVNGGNYQESKKKKDQQFPISTSKGVISFTRKVRFPPAQYDFTRIVVILSLTTVITSHNTIECDFNTHKIGFYTQSKISTRRVWFFTQSMLSTHTIVSLTRMRGVNMTLTSQGRADHSSNATFVTGPCTIFHTKCQKKWLFVRI